MALGDWLAFMRCSSLLTKPHRRRRRRHIVGHVPEVQALEERILLATPVAIDDSYQQVYNSWNVAFNKIYGNVLNNDYDQDGNIFYAELVSGPSEGTINCPASVGNGIGGRLG